MEETNDSQTRVKGNELLLQVKSFNFIICLEIMEPIILPILNTSTMLQSPNIDLNEAVICVQALYTVLQNYRTSDNMCDSIYLKALGTCQKLGVEIPRARNRKIPRRIDFSPNIENNIDNDNKSKEIKFGTFYPVLDSFILHTLTTKFSQKTTSTIDGLGRCIHLNSSKDDHEFLCEQYSLSVSELESEIQLLKARTSNNYLLRGWLIWLHENEHRQTTYNNFRKMLRKFAAILVTSCTCERSFSKLASLKTKLRSTMGQDRLSSLMLLYIK